MAGEEEHGRPERLSELKHEAAAAISAVATSPPRFSFGAAFKGGWSTFRRNYAALIGATLVYLAASLALNVLQRGVQEGAGRLVMLLVSIAVMPPLWAGLLWMGAKGYRDGKASVGDVFRGFSNGSRYIRVVAIQVIVSVMTVAAVMLIFISVGMAGATGARAAGGGLPVMLSVSLVLAGAASLFIMARFMFAIVLPLDSLAPHVGIFGALGMSWRMTQGLRWLTLAAVYLASVVIVAVSFVLLIFPGVVFGMPLFLGVLGASYVMLAQEAGVGAGEG